MRKTGKRSRPQISGVHSPLRLTRATLTRFPQWRPRLRKSRNERCPLSQPQEWPSKIRPPPSRRISTMRVSDGDNWESSSGCEKTLSRKFGDRKRKKLEEPRNNGSREPANQLQESEDKFCGVLIETKMTREKLDKHSTLKLHQHFSACKYTVTESLGM